MKLHGDAVLEMAGLCVHPWFPRSSIFSRMKMLSDKDAQTQC